MSDKLKQAVREAAEYAAIEIDERGVGRAGGQEIILKHLSPYLVGSLIGKEQVEGYCDEAWLSPQQKLAMLEMMCPAINGYVRRIAELEAEAAAKHAALRKAKTCQSIPNYVMELIDAALSGTAGQSLLAELESVKKKLDAEEKDCLRVIAERDSMESALSATHVALGGDGEWVGRNPQPPPPDSGDLREDVPEIAVSLLAERDAYRADLRNLAHCIGIALTGEGDACVLRAAQDAVLSQREWIGRVRELLGMISAPHRWPYPSRDEMKRSADALLASAPTNA